MSLVEIARFPSLAQAEVAASALNGAGIRADVFDRQICTNVWYLTHALGGPRVMAPANQAEAAWALISPASPAAMQRLRPRARHFLMPALVLTLNLLTGWAYAGIAAGAYVHARRTRTETVAEQSLDPA